MFNGFYRLNENDLDSIRLAFVKSLNVRAYPCGRRRSAFIDVNDDSVAQYCIPFDPEARLNTELNNRKHSSINGFTDTYIKEWSSDKLSLVLSGYSFEITLDPEYSTVEAFATKLSDIIETGPTELYANIRLEETPLYTGNLEYSTWVLRNQSGTDNASVCLDLLRRGAGTQDEAKADYYYFSGLSFTDTPLTDIYVAEENRKHRTSSEVTIEHTVNTPKQKVISLCILKKIDIKDESNEVIDSEWIVNQAAYLPKIEHGTTENSVILGDVHANNIISNGIQLTTTDENNTQIVLGSIPAVKVAKIGDNQYRLQLFFEKTPQTSEYYGILGESELGSFILGKGRRENTDE